MGRLGSDSSTLDGSNLAMNISDRPIEYEDISLVNTAILLPVAIFFANLASFLPKHPSYLPDPLWAPGGRDLLIYALRHLICRRRRWSGKQYNYFVFLTLKIQTV